MSNGRTTSAQNMLITPNDAVDGLLNCKRSSAQAIDFGQIVDKRQACYRGGLAVLQCLCKFCMVVTASTLIGGGWVRVDS